VRDRCPESRTCFELTWDLGFFVVDSCRKFFLTLIENIEKVGEALEFADVLLTDGFTFNPIEVNAKPVRTSLGYLVRHFRLLLEVLAHLQGFWQH